MENNENKNETLETKENTNVEKEVVVKEKTGDAEESSVENNKSTATKPTKEEKIYKNNMWYTDEQIISALNKTSFRNDLNNMLRKYGIKCNCFNCDGLALVQTRKDILQEYLYDPNINILVIVPIVAHISSIK